MTLVPWDLTECPPGRHLVVGMIFVLQVIVGILGNFFVLYYCVFLYHTRFRFRSTDLILKHLTVANLFVLLFKGFPQTMVILGWKPFLSDFGCKLVSYGNRVGRDVSIGTTCLLSVFQVIMISPRDSRWAELKGKAPRYVGISTILCWILHLMLNILVLFHMTGVKSNTNITGKKDYGYCHSVNHSNITDSLYIALLLFHDGFCLGLMIWSSGSMVFLLYKHKQRVQYIRRNNLSPRSYPEATAMQNILKLLCTFVCLWTPSCIIHIWLGIVKSPNLWLVNISTLVSNCFPTVSPYILMSHDSRVSLVCFPWKGVQNH
ncbi:vomeronasal type-1 receptor 4-like [Equus asinus]|uniref:vomeronasal type-1 receptor 4-like n=1 Tax=Equus asinus TaxID=9793 RepID=UPI00071A028F|nr:vomeronasal type-1 receptor 4-like [Equus asinus]